MEKRFAVLGIVLAFVIGISFSTAQGISPFTEIGNLSAETLNAINDVVVSLNVEILRIDSLISTQISEQSEQDGIQVDINLAELDILNNKNRLAALENKQFVPEFGLSLRASLDGAVNPLGFAMLYHGDVLCKIETGSTTYIQFGSNTTVKHENNCSPNNGNLISLASGITENFTRGDVLVLEKNFVTGFSQEVFRDQ